jgi:putative transcriptional regulator
VPDVRAIREELGLSQQAFASAYRIPLATLKGWEQGRRQPDATASAYLSVIAGCRMRAKCCGWSNEDISFYRYVIRRPP